MRIRSAPSVPEHWSKDFVEHLRAVHFALVTVAVGLIVLLSSKPYNPNVAETELTDVITLRNILRSEPIQVPYTPTTNQTEGLLPYTPWFEATVNGISYTFHLPEHVFLICYGDSKAETFRRWRQLQPFNSVRRFSEWWDDYHNTDYLYSIASIMPTLHIVNEGKFHESDSTLHPIEGGAPIATAIQMTPGGPCRLQDPVNNLRLGGHDHFLSFYVTVAVLHRLHVTEPDSETGSIFHYPVADQSFSKGFADLREASWGREDVDLDNLATQLYEEANRDEAFDAFGVKVPSQQLTRWGIVALIAIQLYLLMYLQRLFNKLRPDDPGWDIPWMAMDQSVLAKCMLFFSMVLLPLGAAALVVYRSASQLDTNAPLFYVFGRTVHWNVIWTSGGACICILLSILCWKYRPKVSEPVIPRQLFE